MVHADGSWTITEVLQLYDVTGFQVELKVFFPVSLLHYYNLMKGWKNWAECKKDIGFSRDAYK